jgi:hypothetical protein
LNIWDVDKLFLFIIFVIPGFISIKTYELLYPSQQKDSSKQMVDAVTYSCINFAMLFWVIQWVESTDWKAVSPVLYVSFYMFVLLVSPILIVFAWKYLRESETFKKNLHHPTEKSWDYFFSQKKSYWAKVVLKDGTIIGGLYGAKSFASSAPASEQIYLEEKWLVTETGKFERAISDTAGVIILTSEISHIEFRDIKNDG